MVVQGGAFGEHRFTEVRYTHRTSEYPGATEAYAAPPVTQETRTISVGASRLRVVLPPATEIRLEWELCVSLISRPQLFLGRREMFSV